MSVNLTTRVPMTLYDRLRQLSEAQAQTLSDTVRALLAQALRDVSKERKHVKPHDNNRKQEGIAMEDKDFLQLTKELTEKIEDIKLKQVEDRHVFERAIDDLRSALEDLEEAQAARNQELKAIRKGLMELSGNVLDKSSLEKTLEEICKSNPDNPLCRLARKEARKAAKDVVEEAKPKGGIQIEHSSWEEVWSCPECREILVRQGLKYNAWENVWEDVLKRVLPDDVRRKSLERMLEDWKKEHEEKKSSSFF